MIRKWFVTEALTSVRRLRGIIGELTEEELLNALTVENGTRRRSSILRLLETRAAKLSTIRFFNSLKENINGPLI